MPKECLCLPPKARRAFDTDDILIVYIMLVSARATPTKSTAREGCALAHEYAVENENHAAAG